MSIPIFTWSGKYFGFIIDNNFYDADGNYLGWIEETYVYQADGNFLGEIINDNYILRSTVKAKPIKRVPKIPPIKRVPPLRQVNRIGYIKRISWEDALELNYNNLIRKDNNKNENK